MTTMKQWVIAAILIISGTSVFTGCSNSNGDNPVNDNNLSEKIIGKWILAENNGELALTNLKTVITFVSPTKAYGPQADCYGTAWNDDVLADVRIEGNKVALTAQDGDGVGHLVDMAIRSISDKYMYMDFVWRVVVGGETVYQEASNDCWERITEDYSDAILGVWQGKRINDESGYDDGNEHRWAFHADDTYTFYDKVNGEWQAMDDVINDYIVDGTLLCTRWQASGAGEVENREWWEIESVKNGVMKWKALRMREDGSTYTATYELVKVQ